MHQRGRSLVWVGLVSTAVVAGAVLGCGQKPPEPTGEAYTPPPELDKMKQQMFEAYKAGKVGKAPRAPAKPQ